MGDVCDFVCRCGGGLVVASSGFKLGKIAAKVNLFMRLPTEQNTS